MKTINIKLFLLTVLGSIALLTSSCVTEEELNDYGSIHGTIIDAINGQPINNVAVTLTPGGKTTVTGSDGSYQYIDITPGEYTVQAQSAGYQSNSKSVTVEAGTVARCDMQLVPGNGTLFIQNPNARFGLSSTSQSVLLRNTGTDRIEWSVEYNCTWISAVTPASGSIDPNGSATLTIRINRALIPDNQEASTIVMVNSTGGNATIYVSANGSENTGDASGVVPAGLYGYYTFEDNARPVAGSAPGGSAATCTYAAGAADGSKALVLSKSSRFAVPEGLIDKEQFSISFWAKGLSAGHLFHVVNGENAPTFVLNMNGSGMFHFFLRSYDYAHQSYETSKAFTNGYVSPSEWHMVTLTSEYHSPSYGQATTKLYIDGEYTDSNVNQNAFSTGTYGRGAQFVMGGEVESLGTGYSDPAIGFSIDNLRIYHRPLTDSEVAQIYLAERGY